MLQVLVLTPIVIMATLMSVSVRLALRQMLTVILYLFRGHRDPEITWVDI